MKQLEPNNLAYLVVGARGWEHPRWETQFYPDDLPSDWKLGFYANEFRCVLVPAEEWINADDAVLEQWADDVDADFSLFFELPDTPQLLPEGLESLGSVLTGFVASTKAEQIWRPVLEDWPILTPISDGHSVMSCYALRGESRPSLVVFDPGDAGCELVDLRAYIESVLQGVPTTEKVYFIIAGQTPSLETMKNVNIIAELLGA